MNVVITPGQVNGSAIRYCESDRTSVHAAGVQRPVLPGPKDLPKDVNQFTRVRVDSCFPQAMDIAGGAT
jgi:hypothetical protein